MHLHVVLTEACKDGMHLIASASSIKEDVYHDPTTVLAVGEHKFITKPSFIAYRLTCTMVAAHIEKMIKLNYYKPQLSVTDEICQRICDGVEKSEHTTHGMKKYYKENGAREKENKQAAVTESGN
jgi:hypothetical protein